MTATPKQQNGKHEIPRKQTNRRLSASALLTDLELYRVVKLFLIRVKCLITLGARGFSCAVSSFESSK